MAPTPPVRLVMMTVRPSTFSACGVTARMTTSVEPPAPHWMMPWMSWFGYGCAVAGQCQADARRDGRGEGCNATHVRVSWVSSLSPCELLTAVPELSTPSGACAVLAVGYNLQSNTKTAPELNMMLSFGPGRGRLPVANELDCARGRHARHPLAQGGDEALAIAGQRSVLARGDIGLERSSAPRCRARGCPASCRRRG